MSARPSRPECAASQPNQSVHTVAAVGLAFAGGLAFAESPMTREPTTGRSVVTSLPTSHWLASNIYKANVYDPSENKIGDVSDLIIDSDGNVTAAVISVGGFLGVGQKDVEIHYDARRVRLADPQSNQR
jgi:sporulation protein YlmC with PRC-barrel domain